MAELNDLPLRHRFALAIYRWRRIDPVRWSPLTKPIERARLAVVTSAGLYRPHVDAPFTPTRGGDTSFRVIPDDVDLQALVVGQTSDAFDRRPLERDRNAGFPLDRLHELADDGAIGAVAPRHISINGSITAPGRLVGETAPSVAGIFRADQVDAALLVPV